MMMGYTWQVTVLGRNYLFVFMAILPDKGYRIMFWFIVRLSLVQSTFRLIRFGSV